MHLDQSFSQHTFPEHPLCVPGMVLGPEGVELKAMASVPNHSEPSGGDA